MKYDNEAFKEVSIITGNTRLFTLQDTYKNLPTTLSDTATSLSSTITQSSNDNITHTNWTSNNLWGSIYQSSNNDIAYTNQINQNNLSLIHI